MTIKFPLDLRGGVVLAVLIGRIWGHLVIVVVVVVGDGEANGEHSAPLTRGRVRVHRVNETSVNPERQARSSEVDRGSQFAVSSPVQWYCSPVPYCAVFSTHTPSSVAICHSPVYAVCLLTIVWHLLATNGPWHYCLAFTQRV